MLEFLTGKSFGCFFQLPHEMTILPCIAACLWISSWFRTVDLRFCNLKTVASTLHGIPGVHAKPDTLSVFLFSASNFKCAWPCADMLAVQLNEHRSGGWQSLWDPNFAIGCEHTNTWNTAVHRNDSGHSNCGDSSTCVTDVSDGAAPSQFPPVDCGSPREEMTGKPSCHWRTGGSLSTPWPFATRMKANLDKVNSDKRNSRV